jgi:hypothetical protein
MTTAAVSSVEGGDIDRSGLTRDVVTVIMGIVVGLTFLFGFGNVLSLGLRLGVSVWVAPLVAPAVDLSVVALLVATRHLATRGATSEALRPARQLLMFSSVVTLALNVADPLIAGEWGKAAFDSVGPLLLIGWAHVGPDLLLALGRCPTSTQVEEVPVLAEYGDGGEVCLGERVSEPDVGAGETVRKADGVWPGDLLARARAVDAKHRAVHQRPVSAETLRRELRVGAHRARALVDEVRREHLAMSAA